MSSTTHSLAIAAHDTHPAAASITDVTDHWPGWSQILDTLTLRAGFNTNTVILGSTMLGLAAGIIGAFALLRKRSLMADALSHATLPGIALAFLAASALNTEARSMPLLLLGGAATGVLGVLCVHALLRFTRLREDASIGIVLSVFFGAGIVALSYIQANHASGAAGLNKFIYGQTAAMSTGDSSLMCAIAGIAVLAALLLYKELSLVCFNDEFASVVGWPVSIIDLIMMGLVVLVTVAGLQAVGLILVVALLIIPPVAARFWTERLLVLLIVAGMLGAASGFFGSVISSLLPRKPAGAVIVLTAGALFIASLLFAPPRGLLAVSLRRFRLRLRVACEHMLEFAYDQCAGQIDSKVLGCDQIATMARMRGWPIWFKPLVLQSLSRAGYIRRQGSTLALTAPGIARGAAVHRNHALWEQYLTSFAEVAPSHVDWSVDQVEHVLSPALVAQLEAQLQARGIRIPARVPHDHLEHAITP